MTYELPPLIGHSTRARRKPFSNICARIATENTAVVQALIDNLVARGLDPAVPRLFIIEGSIQAE